MKSLKQKNIIIRHLECASVNGCAIVVKQFTHSPAICMILSRPMEKVKVMAHSHVTMKRFKRKWSEKKEAWAEIQSQKPKWYNM